MQEAAFNFGLMQCLLSFLQLEPSPVGSSDVVTCLVSPVEHLMWKSTVDCPRAEVEVDAE